MTDTAARPSLTRVFGVALCGALLGAALWAGAAAATLVQTGIYSMLVAGAVVLAVQRFAAPARGGGSTAVAAAVATLGGSAGALLLSIGAMFAVSHDVSIPRVFEALSVEYLLETSVRLLSWYDAVFALGAAVLAAIGVSIVPESAAGSAAESVAESAPKE